jgi:hypothetical protein
MVSPTSSPYVSSRTEPLADSHATSSSSKDSGLDDLSDSYFLSGSESSDPGVRVESHFRKWKREREEKKLTKYEEEISILEEKILFLAQEQFSKSRELDASFESRLEDIISEIVPLVDISLTLNGTLPSEKGKAKKIDLLVKEKTTHLSDLLRDEELRDLLRDEETKKQHIENKKRKIEMKLEK